MHAERDFRPEGPQSTQTLALIQDLELETIFATMAASDSFLLNVARTSLLDSLQETSAITYRQTILKDCLSQPRIVRDIYAIVVEAIDGEKRIWRSTRHQHPDRVLYWSVELLSLFLNRLRRLRAVSDQHCMKFRSAGLVTLCNVLQREVNDEYLASVEQHLRALGFRDGLLMSAELGEENRGMHYVLRGAGNNLSKWAKRLHDWIAILPRKDRESYLYQLPERDESGANALAELRNRGITGVAAALAESADHVLSFFSKLREELAFYIGCLNLFDRLASKEVPICFPELSEAASDLFSCNDLCDVSLSLTLPQRAVGNQIGALAKSLVMITGANRGGKSTLLRSVGQAQLMMQSGMFVCAGAWRAGIKRALFTHFKRKEDPSMRSGKLDEELARLSAILDKLSPNSMVLFNESFASTNVREASEIGRQIVTAMLEGGVRIVYVTHLFEMARSFSLTMADQAVFLRAERLDDGRRTFRVIEGAPLPTSFGQDLYWRMFGTQPPAQPHD